MFDLRPYKFDDIKAMLEQPSNVHLKPAFLGGVGEWAEKQRNSFTGWLGDKPVVCGGITPYWPGRGQIWTVFDESCRDNFIPVFRGMKIYLEKQLEEYRRIEICIPCDFEIGCRRAELLGFELETPRAKRYLPEDADAALYVLLRKGD